ncbi:hypothetical protein [Jiangella alkaliphila]|uniref:hypothetical protein n=1 Tax=Jiangella alkaliphila TaxID=419479 RepID=UPI00128BB4D4|nr:hypothetical protein [Jiangella alkaliphila]
MDWASLAVASIPAVAAITSAVVAYRSARTTKRLELQASRIRDLENRLAEKKFETYKPMIDALNDLLDPAKSKTVNMGELGEKFNNFDAWIAIFGSDQAVSAWHRLRQASFHNPPAEIFIRLYADFVIAARRDMGYPDSEATGEQLIGSRLRDLYSQTGTNVREALQMNWVEVERRTGWAAPWSPEPAQVPPANAQHQP